MLASLISDTTYVCRFGSFCSLYLSLILFSITESVVLVQSLSFPEPREICGSSVGGRVRDTRRGEGEAGGQGLTKWLCFFISHVWFPLKKSLHFLNPNTLSGHRCVLFARGHTHNPACLLLPAVPSLQVLIG